MKNEKYHTVGTVPETHIYMTVHFPGFIQAFQIKVAGLNYF